MKCAIAIARLHLGPIGAVTWPVGAASIKQDYLSHDSATREMPMHANALLITKLFTSLNSHDHEAMAACYHADATFSDIAFSLQSKAPIHAMWHMIAVKTDLRATFAVLSADDQTGSADLIDDYTFTDTGRLVHNVIRSYFRFRDGLIVEHRDSCSALRWGIQALGPIKGFASWVIPALRRKQAKAKLEAFIADRSK